MAFVLTIAQASARLNIILGIIDADWLPTPANINSLPEPLRRYIHDLESFSGTDLVQENHELRQNFKGANALLLMYKKTNQYNRGGCMTEKNEIKTVSAKDIQIIQPGPMGMALEFLSNGGDLENLEKMMDLQERFDKNEAKKAFFSAMVDTQREMPVIYEGRKNNQTKSNYAAYKDIVRDAKPIYTKFCLSVSFYEEEAKKDDYIKLCADVYHEKGHCRKYSTSIPIDDKGPKGTPVKTKTHGVKSAISYGRGILLCNIFNIPTNEDVDDDGNAAGVKLIDKKQISQITDMINSIEGFTLESFLSWAKIETLENMPVYDYGKNMSALKAKAKASKK